ncbi:MAG: replicative DNA helicase [Sphingomonadales bacterium]|jgi:replicative DNA helicase
MCATRPDFLDDTDTQEEGSFRKPPHNLEAEQAVLGAILVNNEALDKVLSFLDPEHFFEPVHGRIFETIIKLREKLQAATPITLRPFFEKDEALQEVGGAQGYLARLAGAAITIINVEDYGRLIVDLADRRAIIRLGETMVIDAYEADVDESAQQQIEAAEQSLFNLSNRRSAEGGFVAFSHALTDAVQIIDRARKQDGISGKTTGMLSLDRKMAGLQDSDLIILAGRPGMGKTALATNIGFKAAQTLRRDKLAGLQPEHSKGAVVGFFSLEMSADQLATRILAQESGVSSEDLRKGTLSDDEFRRVARASSELSDLPFFIDDTPGLSIAALRARARRLHRRHGLGLIIVDYLQLLSADGGKGRGPENRVQEISEISRSLKGIAKSLRVPVMALSQLSRSVEQREDKRPQLSDLRESGSIEQDADIVMFVYREEYYHARKKPDESDAGFAEWQAKAIDIEGRALVDIAKNRHGSTGFAPLRFIAESTKFEDPPPSDNSLPDQTI